VILAEDEASLYLQATTMSVFAPVGQTPVVRVAPQRDKVSFYGTINLETGKVIAQSCTPKVGPSACVRELAFSRSCAMIDTASRGGQDGKAVFAQAQVPGCDGGTEG